MRRERKKLQSAITKSILCTMWYWLCITIHGILYRYVCIWRLCYMEWQCLRWGKMSWAELSKLEFLIKFHQFDNRHKFIAGGGGGVGDVVANNVKRRRRCRRRRCRRRCHCQWKAMYRILLCTHRKRRERKNFHRKCVATTRHDKKTEYVFYSNQIVNCLESLSMKMNWIKWMTTRNQLCAEIFAESIMRP